MTRKLLMLTGAVAFAGALAYAELAARRPHAGGEYVYLRESFGSLAAFLTGWTSFVAGFSGAIAAGAVGATVYLDRLVPGVANSSFVAIALIVVFSLVHARGLTPGRVLQNSLTILKVGGLGTSSGGHLLLLNALRPRDARYTAHALPGTDAGLAFAIACWPVADPLARYRAVQQRGNDRLVDAHLHQGQALVLGEDVGRAQAQRAGVIPLGDQCIAALFRSPVVLCEHGDAVRR